MAFINSTKRGQPCLFLKSPWLQDNATQFEGLKRGEKTE